MAGVILKICVFLICAINAYFTVWIFVGSSQRVTVRLKVKRTTIELRVRSINHWVADACRLQFLKLLDHHGWRVLTLWPIFIARIYRALIPNTDALGFANNVGWAPGNSLIPVAFKILRLENDFIAISCLLTQVILRQFNYFWSVGQLWSFNLNFLHASRGKILAPHVRGSLWWQLRTMTACISIVASERSCSSVFTWIFGKFTRLAPVRVAFWGQVVFILAQFSTIQLLLLHSLMLLDFSNATMALCDLLLQANRVHIICGGILFQWVAFFIGRILAFYWTKWFSVMGTKAWIACAPTVS